MSPSPLTPENPSATAVLCVECQNGVIGSASLLPDLLADIGDLVPNLKRLLTAARTAGVHVVHATYEGALGGNPVGTARLWRVTRPASADWTPGSEPTRPLPELHQPTDLVLARHHGLFPTADTGLLPVLRGLGVDTIVLAGVSLNVALPHTAGDAAQAGFRVVVPSDAVAGSPPAYAADVLKHSMALIGRITTVDDLVAEWSARAESNAGNA